MKQAIVNVESFVQCSKSNSVLTNASEMGGLNKVLKVCPSKQAVSE